MVMPVIVSSGATSHFYWNLSANVGLGSPNKIDDVQLVQLGYAIAAKDPMFNAAVRSAFSKVVPGAPYAATEADPLTIAIRAHQADRGGTQDGHVSVIVNLKLGKYDATNVYMLVPLVSRIWLDMPNQFPRIDQHPKCPPALRAAVRAFCVAQP